MFRTLIAPENLAPHLEDAKWVVLDCRHDLAHPEAGFLDFTSGHIPGAMFADVDKYLAGAKTGRNGRHPLPEVPDFIAFLKLAGVDDDTQVVGYDAQGGIYAARLWWLMNWIGHPRVAVLDGGLQRWTSEGRTLSREMATGWSGSILAGVPAVPQIDTAGVAAILGTTSRVLVDARAPERYRGEVEPLDPVAGHIPGALNRSYQNNLNADGRFKPAAELRAEFSNLLGDTPASAVIHQCGSGITACHNLLAMEIAGLHGSALYPGSWSEWCADPARPVVRGPAAAPPS
jgi:thiosulfate/3-mercaptopyruvate sulfurtransferase